MTLLPPLNTRTIGEYLTTLGSPGPTPGGGSVAGLVGALAAALGQMVASVTAKGSDDPGFNDQIASLQTRLDAFVKGAETDESAYGGYIMATKLPKATDDEKAARREAIQQALHAAARAPLAIATNAADLLEELRPVIERGGVHILSDAEIAVLLAEVAVIGGLANVRANIPFIKDESLVTELERSVADLESRAAASAASCRNLLHQRRNA